MMKTLAFLVAFLPYSSCGLKPCCFCAKNEEDRACLEHLSMLLRDNVPRIIRCGAWCSPTFGLRRRAVFFARCCMLDELHVKTSL